MPVQPTTLPAWDTTAAGTTSPPSPAKQAAGFVPNEIPPAEWLDWLHYWAYAWIVYFKALLTRTISVPVDPTASSIADPTIGPVAANGTPSRKLYGIAGLTSNDKIVAVRARVADAALLPWATTTTYAVGQRVTRVGNTYVVVVAGTSSTPGPGTTSPGIVDGTVTWDYVAPGAAGSMEIVLVSNLGGATTVISRAHSSGSGALQTIATGALATAIVALTSYYVQINDYGVTGGASTIHAIDVDVQPA